jgi:hypothetical protein
MLIRFVVLSIDEDSLRETGVFQAVYHLRDQGKLHDYEESLLQEVRHWFNAHLKKPARFTTSKPPYYRKQSRAISWFKESAVEHIAKVRQLAGILEAHDISTRMIKTDKPGYVVYEDEYQVVAEPFADSDF